MVADDALLDKKKKRENPFKIGQLALGVSLALRGNQKLQLAGRPFVVNLSSE